MKFFGLLLILLYLSYFFLDEKVFKKSRQNDASAHRPLGWPAVLPGQGFIPFSVCHPELVEGSRVLQVRRGELRMCRGKVRLRRGEVRLCRGNIQLRRYNVLLRRGEMRLRRCKVLLRRYNVLLRRYNVLLCRYNVLLCRA